MGSVPFSAEGDALGLTPFLEFIPLTLTLSPFGGEGRKMGKFPSDSEG